MDGVHIDPPYFLKGKGLYLNAYEPDHHILIAHTIKKFLKSKWIISYDDVPEIRDLYTEYRQDIYPLNYTAANRYHGSEVVIYGNDVIIPNVENPFMIDSSCFKRHLIEIANTAVF